MLSLVFLLLVFAQVLERAVPTTAASDPTVNNPFSNIITNFVTETNAAGVATARPNGVTTQSSSTTTSSSTSSSSSIAAVSTTLRRAHTTSTSRTASASTASPKPSTSGLTTGAKAGIGVGVAIGVLLIAAGAFYFGKREKAKTPFVTDELRNSQAMPGLEEKEYDVQPEPVIKPELHGQQAPTPELPGSPVLPRQGSTVESPREGSWKGSPAHTMV